MSALFNGFDPAGSWTMATTWYRSSSACATGITAPATNAMLAHSLMVLNIDYLPVGVFPELVYQKLIT
jgi:hypothetical protein